MAIEAGTSTYYQAKRGIVQDGLVLHLDAGVKESYSGGTTWRDLSGNGNDAALTGTYEYSRSEYPCVKFNNGYELNGDGRGIVNFSTLSASDNTIECIFKINRYKTFTSQTNMQTSLFTSGRHSGCGYARHLGTYSNGVNGTVTTNRAFWYVAGQIDGGYGPWINTGSVYHLIVTFATNSVKYYFNNTVSWSDTRTTTQFGFSGVWAIGNSRCSAQNQGQDIDFYALRTYNKALSVDEVSRNYNATRHRFGL
jgi:hypothetical protein